MPRGYRDIIEAFIDKLSTLETDTPSRAGLQGVADLVARQLEAEDNKAKYCSKCGTMSIFEDNCENCERMGFSTDSFYPPDWELPIEVNTLKDVKRTVKRLHELLTKARLAASSALEFYNELRASYGTQDESKHEAFVELCDENNELKAEVHRLEGRLETAKGEQELDQQTKKLERSLKEQQVVLDQLREVFKGSEVEPERFALVEAVAQLRDFVEDCKELAICTEEGTHAYECPEAKAARADTSRGECNCLEKLAIKLRKIWPQFQ